MVPHSYKSDPDFFSRQFDRCHHLVIDCDSWHQGFYRQCRDPDQHIPRQPFSNWGDIKYVDFKLNCDPTPQQLALLDQFRSNSQPHKILHVALSRDADSSWISSLTWSPSTRKIVLDLHDYRTKRSFEQKQLDHQLSVEKFTHADYHWMDREYLNLKLL